MGERGGVLHRLLKPCVDGRRLVADAPGKQEDRNDQGNHDEDDDQPDDVADQPSLVRCEHN